MKYTQLSQSGLITELVQASSGSHPSRFCFVLGAGASKSSGILMGQELVDIWETELIDRNKADYDIWIKELGITDENKYNFYSQFYEKRFQKRPIDGLNYLEKMMEHVNPNIGYVVLSHILTKTPHNIVITTNFDHLIEDAVNYYAHTLPLIIGHESLAHYVSRQLTRPTIIKIHRDLLFDPKNTVNDVNTLHEAWRTSLGIIFSEYHPIFIGYAGNDNSLMDFLIENCEKFRTGAWKFPYWTLYKTDKPIGKVKDFLDLSEGYCINCNGFDELLCLLGSKLDYKLPTEKQFLKDAEERYQRLKDAFDKIVSSSPISVPKNDEESADPQSNTFMQAMERISSQINDRSAKYIRAVNLYNQNQFDEAAQIMRELVSDEPDNAKFHDALGVILHEQGKFDEAKAEKQRALELVPDSAHYHDSLGRTLDTLKKYEDAEREKRRAVELEPDNAERYDSLSVTLHLNKKYKEAEKESRRAVELDPNNAEYHDSLGITLDCLKRYNEAEHEKRRAVELEPNNAKYHISLSTTLRLLGKKKEAAEENLRAQALGFSPEDKS